MSEQQELPPFGEWHDIKTCPQDGFFIVHQDGAIRMMFRTRGEWQATAVAVGPEGDRIDSPNVRVRETGVYEPAHWMSMPSPPR